MPRRPEFTDDEWKQLQLAPIWVFQAVAGVDGKIDEKEITALAKELSEAHLWKDPFVRDVLLTVGDDLSTLLPEAIRRIGETFTGLERVADILSLKADPTAANNFKKALLLIGKQVAEASGGFLGAGEKVSEKEKLVLVAVATALRVQL
jgi:hypothetical protein